jgi:hypothetical protein
MGRREVKEAKKQYTLMLRPSVVDEIDRLAGKADLTRSQLMSNFIELALDQAKIMEKTGIFSVAVLSRDLMTKFMEKVFSGKVSLDNKGELEIKQ